MLTRGSEITELKGEIPKGVVQLVVAEATVIIPLAGVIDIEAERARLTKEIEKSKANMARLAQRLNNQDFISRAPDEVVEETRELHQKSQSDVEKLQEALGRIAV